MKQAICRHCKQPIRYHNCMWVHDDPKENPESWDYGWKACRAPCGASTFGYRVAEPEPDSIQDALNAQGEAALTLIAATNQRISRLEARLDDLQGTRRQRR